MQPLGTITALVRASDGAAYVGTKQGHLWRVSPAGAVADALATAGAIGPVDALAIDAQNRPVLLEHNRVSRLETDGTLHTLFAPTGINVVGLDCNLPTSPTAGLDVLETDPSTNPTPFLLVHVDANGTPAAPVTLDVNTLSTLQLFGHDMNGALFARFNRYHPELPEAQRISDELDSINAVTGQTSLIIASAVLVFADDATQIESAHNGVVTLLGSDGSRLTEGPSPTEALLYAVVQPDNTILAASDSQLFLCGNGKLQVVAGVASTP